MRLTKNLLPPFLLKVTRSMIWDPGQPQRTRKTRKRGKNAPEEIFDPPPPAEPAVPESQPDTAWGYSLTTANKNKKKKGKNAIEEALPFPPPPPEPSAPASQGVSEWAGVPLKKKKG